MRVGDVGKIVKSRICAKIVRRVQIIEVSQFQLLP